MHLHHFCAARVRLIRPEETPASWDGSSAALFDQSRTNSCVFLPVPLQKFLTGQPYSHLTLSASPPLYHPGRVEKVTASSLRLLPGRKQARRLEAVRNRETRGNLGKQKERASGRVITKRQPKPIGLKTSADPCRAQREARLAGTDRASETNTFVSYRHTDKHIDRPCPPARINIR